MNTDTKPNTYGTRHKVTEIRYRKADKVLVVTFEDDATFELPAELLRVESPSAEVQGHSPSERKVVSGRRHVGIMGIEPVGNYAVRLKFDDLHDSGIYSWDTLRDFGERGDEIWANYLRELEEKGLSREP